MTAEWGDGLSLRDADWEAELMLRIPPVPAPTLLTPTLSPFLLGGVSQTPWDFAPESDWQHCFVDPRVQRVEVRRPRLYRSILDSDARWVNFSAPPGNGRTTLLRQIAEELHAEGTRVMAIWSAHQAGLLVDKYALLADRGELFDLVGENLGGWDGAFTVLIDNYDLAVTSRTEELLRAALAQFSGLRLITTTFDPLERFPLGEYGGAVEVREALTALPVFTYEECSDYLTRALTSLGKPLPSEAEMREAFASTGGVALGAAMTADQLAQCSREAPVFVQLMQTVRRYIGTHYPRELLMREFTLVSSVLSLMPRFRDHHVSLLFPEISRTAVWQLESLTVLDTKNVSLAGEHVWSAEYWTLSKQWNASHGEERRALAQRLSHIGDASGAFEQWLFVGDLARCDRALRARFLTIFEDLTPEAEQQLLSILPDELRGYPMLRKLRALLDPHTTAADMETSASNLIWVARKGSTAQSLLIHAVRAAILARIGRRLEAVRQAEEVLTECPANSSWEMRDEDGERLTYSEAALTATLVLLACGTMPRAEQPLPSCTGCSYLLRRREITQTLLDLARNPLTRRFDVGSKRDPLGYRALIFSPRQCFDDIEAFEAWDESLRSALAIAEHGLSASTEASGGAHAVPGTGTLVAPTPPRIRVLPSSLRGAGECLTHLLAGNLPAAVKLAAQDAIAQPGATFASAIVYLAKGAPGEALQALDTLSDSWGPRNAAVQAVLRACALHRRGQDEPARLTLYAASSLPVLSIAEGFSLIPEEDGAALVRYFPEAAAAFQAARSVGMLGSGILMSEQPPMRALTKKETLVLDGLRRGLNTREIANEGYLSVNTVRTHVRAIAKKLGASGQADILRRAWQLGLIAE